MKSKQPSRNIPRDLKNARVAVLVDTSTSWGRRVHQGIHSYDRQHGAWHLFVEARGLEERFRHLLAETTMPIPDVAQAAGFGSPEYLAYVFRKDVRMSPRAYRQSTRRK